MYHTGRAVGGDNNLRPHVGYMELRVMRDSDEAGAYALIGSSLDEYYAPQVLTFFRMQWPAGQIVACDMLGNIIGYLAGSKLPNGRASVALFCVDGAFRGKGIGSMMLNRFRQSAMMEGISTLQLEVKENNVSAQRFYRKHGFVPTERLENFYNDGSNGIRMVCGSNPSVRSIINRHKMS